MITENSAIDTADNSKPKIRIENIYKIFGKNTQKALKLSQQGLSKAEIFDKTKASLGVVDATFSIDEGEIFVIMGLSGSGKSTLLRLINLLMRPTAGSIYIDDEDITKVDKDTLRQIRRQKMAMVFQSFALLPHISVLDNVAFGLDIAGVPKNEARQKALESLEAVGLEAYKDSRPQALSGGQQQRIGLARALAVEPEVLLMDEAFSALDPLIRSEMQDELLRLQKEHQRTIVFISHDLDEALKIGDRIAIMQDGYVVQVGTPEEILKNPANDYVRAFFRGVDPTSTLSVGDITVRNQVTIIRHKGDGLRTALQRLVQYDRPYGYILSASSEFLGMVRTETLQDNIDDIQDKQLDLTIEDVYISDVPTIHQDTVLEDILETLAQHDHPIPVVDDAGKFKGVVSKNIFLKSLHQNKVDAEQASDNLAAGEENND